MARKASPHTPYLKKITELLEAVASGPHYFAMILDRSMKDVT